LFYVLFGKKRIIIPQEKIYKDGRDQSDIEENEKGFEISRISNSLHTGL
jgi:hypothetical protein